MVALGKVVACWIVGGACLVGCGATTSGESEPGVGDTSAQTGAVVEFEDRFSSLGVFQVTRDDNGKLGIAVRDSIENIGADSVLQKTMAQRSLLGIYSVLHPDAASVPAALARLADELDAQQRLAPATPPPQSEPDADATETGGPVRVLSLAAFNAAVCKDIPSSTTVWRKSACEYKVNNYLASPCCYYTGYRSYAWNESSHVGTHELYPCSTWRPQIPAWTYQWTQWGGECYAGFPRLFSAPVNPGNVGSTVHWPESVVH
jgi:hypothetical protein